jgi:hypothetical protein
MRTNQIVDPFGIEVRISQQSPDPDTADCLVQCTAKLHQVGARASTGHRGYDDVTGAIYHEDNFWIRRVSRDLVTISAVWATLDIVSAGVSWLQPGTVDGGQANSLLARFRTECTVQHSFKHSAAIPSGQKPDRGFLKRREMRDGFQVNLTGEIAMVG